MIRYVFLIIPLLLVLSNGIQAQDTPLQWSGTIETDQRLLLEDEQDWAWNENRLDLSLEKRLTPLQIKGNIWVRHMGPSVTEEYADLFQKDKINPWNLDIRELYADVHGFLFDELDLRIGRQEIAWGTADTFNPTNNLNPYDLEDVLDFGRVMGSDAINLQWYFTHQTSLQMIYIPRFRPAAMPMGVFSGLFDFEIPVETQRDEINVPVVSGNLIMPRNNLSEGANLGVRLQSFAANTDFSFSYVYGRDPMPIPDYANIEVDDEAGDYLAHADMIFPRHHILGADFAGSISRVGIWGEVALFIPESDVVMDVAMPMTGVESSTLLEDPYEKFVIGGDYTFSGGTYLNMQYLRGFLHERGRDELNDYLIWEVERELWRDRLLIQPFTGGLSVTDWDDPGDNYAIFYTPEITYQEIDNFDISLGGFLFSGQGEGIFAEMEDYNMIRLHVEASF